MFVQKLCFVTLVAAECRIEEILSMLKSRKSWVEVVLTGRKAPHELIEAADLVTEMKKVKHYFDIGVKARKGIEF